MSLVIFLFILILLKITVELVYSIIGQMHVQVVHVIVIGGLIFLC